MNDRQRDHRSKYSERKRFQGERVESHDITDDDVLFGRGKGIHIHEGNVRFRKVISEHAAAYVNTADDCSRHAIAKEVIGIVQSKGGRFLRKAASADTPELSALAMAATWETAEPEQTTKKTKQALRDAAATSKPLPKTTAAAGRKEQARNSDIQETYPQPSSMSFQRLLQQNSHPASSRRDVSFLDRGQPVVRLDAPSAAVGLFTPNRDLLSAYIAEMDNRRRKQEHVSRIVHSLVGAMVVPPTALSSPQVSFAAQRQLMQQQVAGRSSIISGNPFVLPDVDTMQRLLQLRSDRDSLLSVGLRTNDDIRATSRAPASTRSSEGAIDTSAEWSRNRGRRRTRNLGGASRHSTVVSAKNEDTSTKEMQR